MLFYRDGPYLICHILFVGWLGIKSYVFSLIADSNLQYPEEDDVLGRLESSLFRATLSLLLLGETIHFITFRFTNMGLAIFNFIYNTLLIIIEATHFIVGITSSSGANSYVWDVNCIGLLIVGMQMVLDAQFSAVQIAAYFAQVRQHRNLRKYQAKRRG